MSIVITGANGFIGKKLVQALSNSAKDLLLVDLHLPKDFSNGLWYSPASFLAFLEKSVETNDITLILHFGAISDAQSSNHELLNKYNTEFTNSLAKHASRLNIPFVFASSMSVYGQDGNSLDTSTLLPYAKSKRESETFIQHLRFTYPEWSCLTLRLSNVFGYDEYSKRHMASIPFRFTLDAVETGSVRVWNVKDNAGKTRIASRDFLFVDDLVVQIQNLIEYFPNNGIFDLGSGKSTSLHDLALVVARATKAEILTVDMPKTIRQDTYQLFTCANNTWMKESFNPSISFEQYVHSLIRKIKST
jgi:ADP-L-glycero-D-manno-heptose 6-epimerase